MNMTNQSNQSLIVSGVPWFDDQGRTVNAHGGCIVKDGDLYWLFGEYKTDDENHFAGFSCYSSSDLVDWKFERIVLAQQSDGLMGPGRIGECVKVLKSPSTGRYVMFIHSDDLEYRDPHICYAVSDTIDARALDVSGPVRARRHANLQFAVVVRAECACGGRRVADVHGGVAGRIRIRHPRPPMSGSR